MDRDLLLLEHLTRKFGDAQQAMDFILEHAENLWCPNGVAYNLGRYDFEFFCKYYLQDIFIPKENNQARELAPVHLEVWKEISNLLIYDKYDKEQFILPRGCAKSTIINEATSCFAHCYKLSRYTIVIGNKDLDAINFISDTRQLLQNEYIKEAFGELVDTKTSVREKRIANKQELELTNDTKIQAYGWGSSVRGTFYACKDGRFRPTLIIADDVQDENDILSENAKAKVIGKWYKEVEECGDTAVYRRGKKIKSATKFLVVGTPLAPDCWINTIKNDPTFKVFHRQVVDFDVDEYFENNKYWQEYNKILHNFGIKKELKEERMHKYYLEHKDKMDFKTIWDKYECEAIAQKYFTKRTEFKQELMCDCENIGENWVKSMRIVKKSEMMNFEKTMLAIDPASTTSRKSDYTAFTVGSVGEDGFFYVRSGEIEKLSFQRYCEHVIKLLKKFTDITHIAIERNTFQGADVIKIKELIQKDSELRNRNLEFINEMQRKNKDMKISSIIDDINYGRIIFNEEDTLYNQQISEFTGQLYTLHDDAIDSLAECRLKIAEIEVVRDVNILDRNLFF